MQVILSPLQSVPPDKMVSLCDLRVVFDMGGAFCCDFGVIGTLFISVCLVLVSMFFANAC